MNYRHQYHAGNFADVFKHVLLVRLLRALQKKEKGLLYLDTHAGRGRYDLAAAATGDTLARKPEWPDGIARLWSAAPAPAAVGEYLALVREFDRRAGNLTATPRFYPGSPWLARLLARPVDRLALCEKHPAECAALQAELGRERGVSIHEVDGYVSLRAMLPPPERRGIILIDPPFEAPDEFAQLGTSVADGLQRFRSGVFAIWYPLTGRARVEEFFSTLRGLAPPPTLACELTIAGENSAIKMRGCGLVVINPPWQFDTEVRAVLEFLAAALAQETGGGAALKWLAEPK